MLKIFQSVFCGPQTAKTGIAIPVARGRQLKFLIKQTVLIAEVIKMPFSTKL